MARRILLALLPLAFAARAFAFVPDTSIDNATVSSPSYVGQTSALSASVYNNGPGSVFDVVVNVTIPAGLQSVSATFGSSPCSISGTNVQCRLAEVKPGFLAIVGVRVNYVVPPTIADGTKLAFTMVLTHSQPDPAPANNSVTVGTTAVTASRLQPSVSYRSSVSIEAGSRVAYDITVTNPNSWVAKDVVVGDDFGGTSNPADAYYVTRVVSGSTAFTCEALPPKNIAQGFVCRADSMPGLQTARFHVEVTTDPALKTGTRLRHHTNVTYLNQVSPFAMQQDLYAFASSAVGLTLSAPASAVAGKDYTATATVRNSGPSDSPTGVLTILPPAKTEIVAVTASIPGLLNCSAPAPATVTCAVGSLAAPRPETPNPDPLKVTMTLRASAAGAAALSVGYANPPSGPSSTARATTTVTPPTTPIDLGVSIAASRPTATVGERLVYTLTIVNNGAEPAAATTASLTLPADAAFAEISPAVPCSGSAPVVCSVGTLAAGDRLGWKITTQPTQTAGAHALTATVASLSPDPNASNNSATSSISVAARDASTMSDLSLQLAGPPMLVAGHSAIYAIAASNGGAAPARDVTVTFRAANNSTLVSLVQSGGATPFTCERDVCRAAILEPQGSATFTAIATVAASTPVSSPLTASASAATSTTEADLANNKASATAQVVDSFTDIALSAPATLPIVAPGETARFVVAVANRGTRAVEDVVVTDELPAGFTLVSATPSQGSCSALVCHLGALAPDATAQIAFVARAPMTTGTATNRATVAAGDAEPNDDAASTAITVGYVRRRVSR